jgi:hypothetical protein
MGSDNKKDELKPADLGQAEATSGVHESGAGPSGPPKAPPFWWLTPHPLVLGLAATVIEDLDVKEAHRLARKARRLRYGLQTTRTTKDDADKRAPNRNLVDPADAATFLGAVTRFTDRRDKVQLVKFAGYLADFIKGDGFDWQVLFLDDVAETYLLIRREDIKFHDRVDDKTAAFGLRDVLWVLGEGLVVSGGRLDSVPGRFTTGSYMRAGDFRTSMSGGGAQAGVSDMGPLCTAFTPCCCGRYSP